jgi:hypothetical protein
VAAAGVGVVVGGSTVGVDVGAGVGVEVGVGVGVGIGVEVGGSEVAVWAICVTMVGVAAGGHGSAWPQAASRDNTRSSARIAEFVLRLIRFIVPSF